MKKILGVVFTIFVAGCSTRSAVNRQNTPEVEVVSISTTRMQVAVERNARKQLVQNLKETERLYQAALYQSRIVMLKQIAISRDGKVLAVAGEGIRGKTSRTVRTRSLLALHDARSGKRLRSIWNYRVGNLLFSRDGKWLVTGGTKMRWWDVATGKLWCEAKTRADSMTFLSDGKTLAIADYTNNRLDIWQMSPLRLRTRFGFMADPGRISLSANGRQVVGSTGLIFNVALNKIKRLPQGSNFGEFPGREIVSPDGRLQVVFLNTNSQTVQMSVLAQLAEVRTGKLLRAIHRTSASDMVQADAAVFTPDGKSVVLAGTGLDNAIKIVRLTAK